MTGRGLLRRSLVAPLLLLSFAAGAAPRTAPEFTLKDVNGKKFDLADLTSAKKVVVVSFFATWCAPCQAELPALQAMQDKLGGQGLQVVAISIDDAKAIADVKPIVHDNKLTFPVLLDPDTKVVSLYNPKKTLPFTAVIDRSGNVASEHIGYLPSKQADLQKEVEGLLAATAPTDPAPAPK